MKIKSLLIGMLACTALVGCTSDDEPVVNNGAQENNGKEYYVAVSFSMPGNSSRATTIGDFQDADATEIAVNNATFFFLNASGNSVADACYVANAADGFNFNAANQPEADDNVNALTQSVIVMKNPTEIPASIVAVINVGNITGASGKLANNARPNLSEIKAVADNYATTSYTGMPTDGMVMSSTSYLDANGNVVIGAPVSASNIFESQTALEKAVGQASTTEMANVAVIIPVEKVLAKIEVSGTPTVQSTDGKSSTNIGKLTDVGTGEGAATVTSTSDVVLTPVIDGWWLDSTPTNSNLLKNIDNINITWNAWNDLANTRSYWANSYTGSGQAYVNFAYSGKVEAADATAQQYAAAIGGSLYCQENTAFVAHTTQSSDGTDDNVYDGNNRVKVVVAATLKNGENPVSLVKWYGNYYTEEGFLTSLANLNDVKKYYIKTTNGGEDVYTSLTKANLQIVSNTDKTEGGSSTGEVVTGNQNNQTSGSVTLRNYEAVVTLADNVTELYYFNGSTPTAATLATVKAEIEAISKIQYWKDGKTYYYVEVEHNKTANYAIAENGTVTGSTGADYGVVRNHLYKLTLTGINGLGTPVPNPDKIIIPERPSDSYSETYISAKIQILSYKVVEQNNIVLQ